VNGLSEVTLKVWTRSLIPETLVKLYPDPTLQNYWVRKIQVMPFDAKEQEMWMEMLQNTDLRTGTMSSNDFPLTSKISTNQGRIGTRLMTIPF
jgi:hypothetical protein